MILKFISVLILTTEKIVNNQDSGTGAKMSLQGMFFPSSLRGVMCLQQVLALGHGLISSEQRVLSGSQCVTFGAFEQKAWLQLSAQLSSQTLSKAHQWKGHGLGLQLLKTLRLNSLYIWKLWEKIKKLESEEVIYV